MQLSSTVAASRGPRLTRRSFELSGLLTAAAVIAATIAISAASGGALLLALLISGAVLLCVWMVVSDRYELTLAILFLYLGLLDGYVKLKLNTSWATLGRDALLYAIVAGALVRAAVRKKPIELPPLTGWVLAFCAVVLIQVFNPANGSWGHSIASVRPHLEFVPLFFLGYWTMRSKTRLRGFLLVLLLVAAVNGIVSFIQFNLTPGQFAGWGPGYEKLIYGAGSDSARAFVDSSGILRTRPFGLGGDAGFGGVVGMLAVPAALALVVARVRARPLFLCLILSLAAGAGVAVITSQARFAVISSVLAALAFGILASVSRRVIGTFVALALAVAVTVATISVVSGNSQSPFRKYKTITPDRVLTTTYNYRRDTLALVPKYATRYPLGAGIGSAGPAGGYGSGLTRGSNLNAESEPTYLLIELGIPGLLLLLAFNLKLFGLALRRAHRLPDVELRLLLAALIAPLFALFAGWIVGIATASSPASPYFWFVAGIAAYWLAATGVERRASAVTAPLPRGRARDRSHLPRRSRPAGPKRLPAPQIRTPAPPLGASQKTVSEAMQVSVLYRDAGAQVDGIRDYSRGLCAGLAEQGAAASLEPMNGRELPTEIARADAVVLQYNPFSYGRRGYAPWLPEALERLNSKQRRPIIAVMVHEPYMPLSGFRASVMGGWQRFQLAKVRRAADVTFVSIGPWVETVQRWGPKGQPVHHVPVGSTLPDMRTHRQEARSELGVSDRAIVLTAFGTSHPSRMPSYVGAGARALHEAGHEVVLVNLGANAPMPEGVPETVRIESPGYLDAADLARRLSAADIFVAPFIDGVTSRRSTFVAALQHGLPVVATEGRLTDDLIRRSGACRLTPVGSPERFARAVVELAEQPAERQMLGRSARLFYEHEFAWPVIADRVLGHLREVFLAHLLGAGS
jgi:glycosyltransferase involved in cell wall biosynthesis